MTDDDKYELYLMLTAIFVKPNAANRLIEAMDKAGWQKGIKA
jgi:hypothetical protein